MNYIKYLIFLLKYLYVSILNEILFYNFIYFLCIYNINFFFFNIYNIKFSNLVKIKIINI